jgi:hypothetical protein
MLIFYLVFLLIALFSLYNNKQAKNIFFICSGLILFSLAASRSGGVDNDYTGYINYYNDILHHSFSRVEPTFILITRIVDRIFSNNLYLFIIYALLGIFLKFYAISTLTSFRLLSVLVYFSGFFLLFEMTQIRAGVAAGLLLNCISTIKERRLGLFIFLASLASLFHYSALVIFPLYFLNGKKLNELIYLLLIPFAYILYYSKFNILLLAREIPIPLVQIKLSTYLYWASLNKTINLFNYVHLSRCLLAFLFLWKWRLIAETNPYSIILTKIYVIAIFIFVAFANIPAISSRISELLMIVEIILIPYLIIILKPKYLSISVVIGIAFTFLNFFLLYTKIFKF